MKDKNYRRQDEHKVLPIDQYRHHFAEDGNSASEKSVYQLLQHMRKIREAVPVNYQLQEDIRKKLLEKQSKVNENELLAVKGNNSRPKLKLRWIGLMMILLFAMAFLILNKTTNYSLQPVGTSKEVVKLWNVDSNLSFSLAPNEGVLIARHGQLLMSDRSIGQYQVLDVDSDWLYYSPAISPNGEQVALVRQQQGDAPQIVAVSMSDLINNKQMLVADRFSVLSSANDKEQFVDLTWSMDGTKLAYTVINKQNNPEVWVLEGQKKRFLTKGMNPTWSPEGTQLVVQRQISESENVLAMIDLEAGTEMLLGEGEQPVWDSNGYLAFVSTRQHERVLTFMSDGTPQFAVRQRVGEIRSVYVGNNGQKLKQELGKGSNWLALSTLLISPDDVTSEKEMDWLRQMELQGIREPRILMIDEVEKCYNPVFGMEGKMLFYARQDRDIATVLQIEIEECPIDQGVK